MPLSTKQRIKPKKEQKASTQTAGALSSKTELLHTLQLETFLQMVRLAHHLQHSLHMQLKPYGVTETQYNCLQILGIAGTSGLTCTEMGEKLINQDPDITRLVGRLEKQGWVRRERGLKDRRVILTKITSAGMHRLQELRPLVMEAVSTLLAQLSQDELMGWMDLIGKTNHSLRRHKP